MKKKKTREGMEKRIRSLAMLFTSRGNSERAGEGANGFGGAFPSNPVHHCTKKSDGTDITDWSYIYFGSYPQSEVAGSELTSAITGAVYDARGDAWVDGEKYRRISKGDTNDDKYFGDGDYRYFKWERIKWRVLRNDEKTLLVVADVGLDCKKYNDERFFVTWKNCSLRQWLNNSFYHEAFSGREQEAIAPQAEDKVFLLSVEEVSDPGYGFCEDYDTCSASRRMRASDYVHARGAYTYGGSADAGNDNCWWWLRSPGYGAFRAAVVDDDGYVSRYGYSVCSADAACAPALRLNLSSDLWIAATKNP